MSKILKYARELYENWRNDRVASLAAALAYYTLFSLAPILLICITIAGMLFGEETARNQILAQINLVMGKQVTFEIQDIIKNAKLPIMSLNTQIISIFTLLFSASGIFIEIQAGLNIIWNIELSSNKKQMAFIKSRLLSFAMVLISALLLLILLLITSLLAALNSRIHYLAGYDIFIELLVSYFFSFVIATFLFALMFKHLPDINLKWSHVWIGAIVTSLLFIIGKIIINFYLNHAYITSVFGAAGSLIMLLIWIYYSAQIFFLGAEITKIYCMKKKINIIPTRNALPKKQTNLSKKLSQPHRFL